MSPPTAHSADYTARKAKRQKSLTTKSTKSRKKQNAETDKLAEFFPGKTLPRAELVAQTYVRLKSLPDPVEDPQSLVDSLSQVFLSGLVPDADKVSELLPMWQQFVKAIEEIQPDAARQIISERYFEAFTWATAGAIGFAGRLLDPIASVLIYKGNKGRDKGKLVNYFRLKSGEIVRAPNDYEPKHPTFLWRGNLWRGRRVTAPMVANVKCVWTGKELQAAFQGLLWRPSRSGPKRRQG